MISQIHFSITTKSPRVLIHIKSYLHEFHCFGTDNKTTKFGIKTMANNNNNRGPVKEPVVRIRQKGYQTSTNE